MIEKRAVVDYFREYEELKIDAIERELKVPVDSELVVSIIGPRRAGKTYYFLSLRDNLRDVAYLNFEDTRLSDVNYKEIRDVIRVFIELYGKNPQYVMLDEVQNIDGWEIPVREMYDLRKYKIFITGSSSKLLSREIATNLRGRAISFILLPFSFREFLRMKGMKDIMTYDDVAKVKNLLREYLEFGGFPDVVKYQHKMNILREYGDLILFRDFIERHNIKNLPLARALHTYVLQNFAREVSIKRIYNKMKSSNLRASKDSVYSYISKLEDTMFFFFLKKYSQKVHIREAWPKKIYLCDTGLTKIVRHTEDYGRLMENVVFLELVRNRNTEPLIDIFYLKLESGEVDFVIQEGTMVKELIQVTHASGRDEIERREIKSLEKASEELKCKKKTVITWDYEGEENGIKFIPLWKWLLSIKK